MIAAARLICKHCNSIPLELVKMVSKTKTQLKRLSCSWPDGTPRSLNNDFTAHLDGRPSIWANPSELADFDRRSTSAATVERMRAMGIEPARLNLKNTPDRAKASA